MGKKLEKKKTFILISILLIFSLFPRLWELTKYPSVIVDEPANTRDVNKLLSTGGFHPADFEWSGGQSTLVFYPTIILLKFGIKDEFLALRLTSVILSILALIPFFFIIKKHTNLLIAFCATLLFSFSYYYLQFSRVGWTNIHALTIGLYFLMFIELPFTKNYLFKVITAGICGGLILYTYRAGEIYIFSGFILLILQLKILKEKLIEKIKYFLIFLITIFLVSFPWTSTIINNWNFFTLRERVVSVLNVLPPYHGLSNTTDILIYQTITTIKSWILMLPINGNAGSIENSRYLPLSYPPLNLFLILFFLLGLIISIKKYKVLYPWIILFVSGLLFGQILTVHPPNGGRALVFLPAIYLFIGIGLNFFYLKYKGFKYIKFLVIIFSIIIALSDFIFYQNWMNWIKI